MVVFMVGLLCWVCGMMLPTLQEQFATSTWLIGWMVAFVNAGGYFAGVSATPLKERFGARTVVTVSGLVAGVSMITAPFLSSLYTIALILTVFAGSAVGISFVITKHLIGSYFNRSVTTAYGVSTLGSSVTFLVAVPLIQLSLDAYGWRGTMLLLGGLFLHLAVVGALMKPPAASGSQDGYEAALTTEEPETRDDDVHCKNKCLGFKHINKHPSVTLLKHLTSFIMCTRLNYNHIRCLNSTHRRCLKSTHRRCLK
ncbi:monocarboxylate transporter 11-like [Asterias amurensis]|uniref:monocarboxylate transporter 11-like n=1 Tax=Asterias amurensis TaxID=7602 RepID=UPI003AB2E849